MTAGVTADRAQRQTGGSARGLSHHVLGHYPQPASDIVKTFWRRSFDAKPIRPIATAPGTEPTMVNPTAMP